MLSQTSPPASQKIAPLGLVGILGCAAGVVGSFMAWITVTSGFGSASVSGTDGDGKITAVVGILAGLLALVGLSKGSRGNVITAALLAVGGAAMSAYEWQNVSSKIDDADFNEFARASVGTGIWVMLAGLIVAAVCLFKSTPHDPLAAHTAPFPAPQLPDDRL
jgi:hypothetical protein